MALPRKLKKMSVYNAGQDYLGEIASATLPKLTRKLEGWRSGGMDSQVKVDLGAGDDLDLEITMGGPMRDMLRQFGDPSAIGVFLRFAGAYQSDDSGNVDVIEVTVRGRWEELDMGDSKVGESGEFKGKLACAYYRLDWNGTEEIEIDAMNGVFRVGGIDRNAAVNALFA